MANNGYSEALLFEPNPCGHLWTYGETHGDDLSKQKA